MSLRSYEVTAPNLSDTFTRTINAKSGGEARYLVMLEARDWYPDATFADFRVRSLGSAVTSAKLRRVAEYRKRPDLASAGTRVRVGDKLGAIVDADDACNFIVSFEDGTRGHAHESDIVLAEVTP